MLRARGGSAGGPGKPPPRNADSSPVQPGIIEGTTRKEALRALDRWISGCPSMSSFGPVSGAPVLAR